MRAHEKQCLSPDDDVEDDDTGSCADYTGLDRKRRRGIIEKRRRDRINFNLGELRRLVPDAAQKQTSTKLEKAEILQMTVEFLHRINRDGTVLNAEIRLLENRLLGFQECFAEVTRFLSALPVVSAVDEVFRKKLLSHLHACIYRRDYEARTHLASLSAMVSNSSTNTHSQSASDNSSGGRTNISHHGNHQTSWHQTPHVEDVNNGSSQVYWQCHPNVFHKSGEGNWLRNDYQGSHHKHQNPRTQTTAVNESQSTTSPSLLGNFEETDSGNSTVNRISPNERDVSTDVSLLHSNQRYTYSHTKCDEREIASTVPPNGYDSYCYSYLQNYSETALSAGTVTETLLPSQEQIATGGYILTDCQTAVNPPKEMSYYPDDF